MTVNRWTTTSQPASDPFDRLKRLAFRRGWIPTALPIVAFLAVVIAETLLQPSAVNQWFTNPINMGTLFAFFAAAAFALRYSPFRSVRRLSPLKSRVKEVALPLGGPTLVLDNGLVVSLLGGRFLLLSLPFGLDGSVLTVPVEEAPRWTRFRRTRRVAMVIPGLLTPLGAELEGLRARLGVRLSFAIVREPRQQFSSPSNPRWIATLTASNTFSAPSIESLATEVDEVEVFLKHLVRPYVDAAVPGPVGSGEGESAPFDIRPASAARPGERPVGVSLWNRFRSTYPGFQRMVGLTLLLTTTNVLGGLFFPGVGSLMVLIIVISGGGLIGASARTRRDGFAGGLIFGWAGTFFGFLILLPLEAGLQGGGLLMIGIGLLAGFAGGLILGLIYGLFGGVAGYVGARLAKKPIRVR